MTNKSCTCKTSPHGFPEIREIFASGIRNLGNFHWSNQILGFDIRSTDKGIRNPRIRIPGTGFQNSRRGIQNSWLSWIFLPGAFFFPVVLIVVLPLLLFSLSLSPPSAFTINVRNSYFVLLSFYFQA